MKHSTYRLLRAAYLGNVDSAKLQLAIDEEKDAFTRFLVNLVRLPPEESANVNRVAWDADIFTSEFRSGDPAVRLDETVMAFLLRVAMLVKEEMHIRTFRKPESHAAIHAWIMNLKLLAYAVFSLLYGVEWTPSRLLLLDETIARLVHEGGPLVLREFAKRDLGLALATETTQAERQFERLGFLNIVQFGSSMWRLLHWMAEAVDRETGDPHAKAVWRELLATSVYRLLRCGICMRHLRTILEELPTTSGDKLAKLWFNIHNRVSATKPGGTHYPESEYELDAEFMRRALPKK